MWLMEQPYLILGGGVLLTIMLVAGLLQTGKRSLIYAVAGVALATLALLFLERTTITPREEVKATLHLIAHELEENNPSGVLDFISDGRPELKQEAQRRMNMVQIAEVDIKSNLKVELVEARGMTIAEARFNCVIRLDRIKGFSDFSDPQQRFPRFFVVRLRQDEDGRWRVRDYEMQDPRNGIGT